MKRTKQMFVTATGVAVAILLLATTAGAVLVEQFNFDHGPGAPDSPYTPVAGEFLNGATYTLMGGASSFVNSPPGGSGQSWYNSDLTAAVNQGYRSVNAPLIYDAFRIDARVYLNTVDDAGGAQIIYHSYNPPGGTYDLGTTAFYIQDGTVKFSSAYAANLIVTSTQTLQANQWYDLAAVYNPLAAYQQQIYVNGVLDAQAISYYGGTRGLLLSGAVAAIGGHSGGSGLGFLNFNGYLDSLMITTPEPEPSTVALLATGFFVLRSYRRRK